MTSPAPMPGPPCDICGDAPAVLSILNYADWQQLRLCGTDAPQVMRGIADTMDGGASAAAAAEAAETAAAFAADDETAEQSELEHSDGITFEGAFTIDGSLPEGATLADLESAAAGNPPPGFPRVTKTLPGDNDDEPGSARDHWASTANVRRSTHGHRTPRKATGTPRKDEPE